MENLEDLSEKELEFLKKNVVDISQKKRKLVSILDSIGEEDEFRDMKGKYSLKNSLEELEVLVNSKMRKLESEDSIKKDFEKSIEDMRREYDEKKIPYIIKRNGTVDEIRIQPIEEKLNNLCGNDLKRVDIFRVARDTYAGVICGMTTSELDRLAAENSAALASESYDYSLLAGRIVASDLQKNCPEKFSDYAFLFKNDISYRTKTDWESTSSFSDDFIKVVEDHKDEIDAMIDPKKDLKYDYFGLQTIQNSYLLRKNNKVVETPQYMLMRVAIQIWGNDMKKVKKTYEDMSNHLYTHASPTLFNSGFKKAQCSSCYLMSVVEDSIEGIFTALKKAAIISKHCGGVGIDFDVVRNHGSYIKGSNGYSKGSIPFMKCFNEMARCVDQGGRRKAGIAIYLSVWHGDVEEFLELTMNDKAEDKLTKNVFIAIVFNNLFMERLKKDEDWSLFSPNEVDNFHLKSGQEFIDAYIAAEKNPNIPRKTVKAKHIWTKCKNSLIATGIPYLIHRDHMQKSNQRNLGTIRISNLCTEINEYVSDDEIAVCNLSSMALPKFFKKVMNAQGEERWEFDYEHYGKIVRRVTKNLNSIIDCNYYPLEETRKSNMRHRPIGIGMQGLADIMCMTDISWTDKEAFELQEKIMACKYFNALKSSMKLAKKYGPYETFAGSPASQGILQFDMWGIKPHPDFDWQWLKGEIIKHGLRNSLLIAPMPTASTSQILGNQECFEPYTNNAFVRKVKAGQFLVVNRHLENKLRKLNLWNQEIRNKIAMDNGSVQNIDEIPERVKEIYRTVWEIPQKTIIDLAAIRGAYICQSQSMNLYINENNIDILSAKLDAMFDYGWKKGLKTGSYYFRSKPATFSEKFLSLITKDKKTNTEEKKENFPKITDAEDRTILDENTMNSIIEETRPIEDDMDEGESCPIGCTSCGS